MHRRGHFIWTREQKIDDGQTFRHLISRGPTRRDDGVNRWVLFRRTFTLPSAPEAARLSVTVDGRYQLFLNGRRIGRGPVRSSPDYQRFDSYEISADLGAGDNVIAVLVHVYGVDMAWYETAKSYWQGIFGDGGLWCESDIQCAGETIEILSDDAWRYRECAAWTRETPRSGWGQDFIEDFDARKMPPGWAEADFDDSAWAAAHCRIVEGDAEDAAKGWAPIEPFPTLLPREIPPLAESPVRPAAIIAAHAVIPAPDLPLDRRLYDEALEDLPPGLIDNERALLDPEGEATFIRTPPGRDVTLLIAFDKRHAGYPFLDIEAEGGEVIELAVAETIPGEYGGTTPARPRLARETYLDCAHLFRYTARPGRQRFEKFEWTAVKFLQLVVRNAPKGVRIHHVGSIQTHYPAESRGAFSCSDDWLTRLWEVGRYTTLLCTHDAWEDCPSREKRQWIGDGIVHYLIGAAAFGPSTRPIDRQFLLQAMESQRPDGLLQMFTPGDHHTNGIIIPDFTLHWVMTAEHYLLHTGDDATIEEIFPAVQRVLAWFERQLGPSGLIVDLPHWHFIEWANVGRRGEAAIVNAMLAGALAAAARLARHLGYERAAGRYETRTEGIKEALNHRHWDATRRVYVDMVDPVSGAQDPQVSQQANAAMILWDIAPRDRWAGMIARIMDPARIKLTAVPPVVPEGDPFDAAHDVVRANTYFGHFLYGALARARRFDLALETIAAAYRPMLETGTETLWESFDPAASLCHAFSASPTYQLSAHVLGVAPTEPGFRRFRVAPQPGGLDFARGVYPSVRGDVAVDWRRAERVIELSLVVPEGAEAEVIAPEGFVIERDNGASVSERSGLASGRHHIRFVPRG